jgi:hypothetical protein
MSHTYSINFHQFPSVSINFHDIPHILIFLHLSKRNFTSPTFRPTRIDLNGALRALMRVMISRKVMPPSWKFTNSSTLYHSWWWNFVQKICVKRWKLFDRYIRYMGSESKCHLKIFQSHVKVIFKETSVDKLIVSSWGLSCKNRSKVFSTLAKWVRHWEHLLEKMWPRVFLQLSQTCPSFKDHISKHLVFFIETRKT